MDSRMTVLGLNLYFVKSKGGGNNIVEKIIRKMIGPESKTLGM